MKTNLQKLILVGFSLVGFVRCESRDFGNSQPDTVAMKDATWEGGVGELVNKKCAGCHTADRNLYVPANTPTELNAMSTKAFWSDVANIGMVTDAKHRVADDEGEDSPMPPKFATPLVGVEKELLLKFLDERIHELSLSNEPVVPPPVEGCAPLPDWNEDMAKTLIGSCANGTCHADATRGGFKKPTLETEAQWMAARNRARQLISAGSMPKGVKGFAATDSGKLLLGTLCVKP